ncbi:hypothetical protein [Flavobacterium alkalisoli]|uniref:hypothetical protein n=1 Tax=Flavobacterium alkalisoli TaxID=2602769 RepID=UPI003A8E9807
MIYTKDNFINTLDVIGVIENETIDLTGEEIIIENNFLHSLEFSNCEIIANKIEFFGIRNNLLEIRFYNCSIQAELTFTNCIIQGIYFEKTKSLKSLNLQKGYNNEHIFEIEQLQFKDTFKTTNSLTTDITIRGCLFKNEFSFHNINHSIGSIKLIRNKFGYDNIEFEEHNFMMQNSTLNNIWFHKNCFYNFISFTNCLFTRNTTDTFKANSFTQNIFNFIYFNQCSFNNNETFTKCEFKDYSYFENLIDINSGILNFIDCIFHQYISFNNSQLNKFSIERSTFKDIASFQQTNFQLIKIDRVNFEKGAYFDEISLNIKGCDRISLRTIKQQLQKAENRIDYNRFRGYELQAYYQELDWKNNFKDKAILWATKASTGFEHSWTKALRFVLTGAAIFYSLFFFSENYMLSPNLDFSSLKDFLSGYFRFLIVTDFYNPLEEKRIFIDNSNTIGWIIFILGKIVLAFGIYEMIQAFRKFKA